jgi:DNA-3-methyladenine glycosylase
VPPETATPLPRSFYARPTLEVARDLIGATLVHESPQGRLSGRIVEAEAYVSPGDEASHAYRGETPRNRVMFGAAGHAYVYVSYGMHDMLNVVTEAAGTAAAVLIRAVEPVEGVELMACNRGLDKAIAPGRQRNLTNGPGRLCQAMAIGRALNGHDLTRPSLYILPRDGDAPPLVQTTRIGITRSVELPWRFYLLGSPHVSVRDRRAEGSGQQAEGS